MMRQRIIDLTGKRFGRLLVQGMPEKRGAKIYWSCVCDCGKEKIIQGNSLREGRTKSCGCLKIEHIRQANKNWRKRLRL